MHEKILMVLAASLLAASAASADYHIEYDGIGHCGALRHAMNVEYLDDLENWVEELADAASISRTQAGAEWPAYMDTVTAYWRARQGYTDAYTAQQTRETGRAPGKWTPSDGKNSDLRPFLDALDKKLVIVAPKPRQMTISDALDYAERVLDYHTQASGLLAEPPEDLIDRIARDDWMRGPNTPGIPLNLAALLARTVYLQRLSQGVNTALDAVWEVIEPMECLHFVLQRAAAYYDVVPNASRARTQLFWAYEQNRRELEPLVAVIGILLTAPVPEIQEPVTRRIADAYSEAAETLRIITLFEPELEASLEVVADVEGTAIAATAYSESILPEAFEVIGDLHPETDAYRTLFQDGAAAMENLAARAPTLSQADIVAEYYSITSAYFSGFAEAYDLLAQALPYLPRRELDILEMIQLYSPDFRGRISVQIYHYEDVLFHAHALGHASRNAMLAVIGG